VKWGSPQFNKSKGFSGIEKRFHPSTIILTYGAGGQTFNGVKISWGRLGKLSAKN